MEATPLLIALIVLVLLLAAAVLWLIFSLQSKVVQGIEKAQSGSQLSLMTTLNDTGERLRDSLQSLQLAQERNLAANREELIRQLADLNLTLSQKQDALKVAMLDTTLARLSEQSSAQQQAMESTLRLITGQITGTIDGLTKSTDARLAEIGGKVSERLDEGFKKTNETFANVMARLATIDEAQKKIDGLTTNVVSLQQLLGDKRSRGAFGEVQLETIVRNVLPESAFEFQYTFPNKTRADCVLKLPNPTGLIAIDAKFPLENYERMFAEGAERLSPAAFKADVRKHIDDIAGKYIISGETADGAVLFLPAEAIFAEIHAHHRDLVEYAGRKRVWLVSPTTLMAVLNTVQVVLRDVETRKQVHVIKDALSKLGADFGRFQARMDDLAKHIGQVSKDVELVHTSSRKITEQFQKIEKAEIDAPVVTDAAAVALVDPLAGPAQNQSSPS
ncbi:MAG: DNA recombination protein RmuC [Betaproteobacteria bacterium]|nr:DNA recombination protein RmuC [Betaproteobacteria bacterium]